MAMRKVVQIDLEDSFRQEISFSIRGDMLGIAMETEFADVSLGNFYTSKILKWYENGHFPCGWEGIYPEGKLIVY